MTESKDTDIGILLRQELAILKAEGKARVTTAPFWSMPECVSWVAWQHIDHLPLPDYVGLEHLIGLESAKRGFADAEGSGAVSTLRQEVSAAWDRIHLLLSEGKLTAYGIAPNDEKNGPITADKWPLLAIDWYRNQARWIGAESVAFQFLTLSRSAIMAIGNPAADGSINPDTKEAMADPPAAEAHLSTVPPANVSAAVVHSAEKAPAAARPLTPNEAGVAAHSKRRGRKPGSGTINDDGLLEEMRGLITERAVTSTWGAAGQVAPRAGGAGTHEAKQARLMRKFGERYLDGSGQSPEMSPNSTETGANSTK